MIPRLGSLYSGVGGADLGLERAGFEVCWQAEADPFRRAVLARHFPGAYQFSDVAAIDALAAPVDLLYAEFPTPHARWLPEILRVVELFAPPAILVEGRRDWAFRASEALGALGYRGGLARVDYEANKAGIHYRRERGYAVALRADEEEPPTLAPWPSVRTDAAAGRFEDTGMVAVPEFFELLVGLPQRWTCLCGEETCYEAAARALAASEATTPAVTEWLGRAMLKALERQPLAVAG